MITTEIERLAAAINALRPDWPTNSIRTFISTHLANRAYRDTALALTWIATDPLTDNPGRVLENGPWWETSRTANTPPPPPDRGPDCHHCGHPRDAHPDLLARMPGYCPGFEHQPDRTPGRRPDTTRNLDRTPALRRTK